MVLSRAQSICIVHSPGFVVSRNLNSVPEYWSETDSPESTKSDSELLPHCTIIGPPGSDQKEAGGEVAQLPDPSSPGEEAFFSACKQGKCNKVSTLLEKRFDVNLQDGDGWSALMRACQEGHIYVAKLLLENGSLVDLQNSNGWSALMIACKEGHCDVVKLLLEYGADVNLQSHKLESAYSVAILHHDKEIGALLEEIPDLHPGQKEHLGTNEERDVTISSRPPLVKSDTNLSIETRSEVSEIRLNPIPVESSPPVFTLQDTASYEDVPLSLGTLTLLKWKDSKGGQHNFKLIDKTSSKWREFGYRFGQEENELENLREECFGKANRCWCRVMNQWIENDGTPEYEATWRGLLTALVDLEYIEVARKLHRILTPVTSPPQLTKLGPTVTPPLKDAMASPPESAMTLPPELVVTPPLEDVMTPPPESAMTPPPEAAETPPLEDAKTPPPESDVTPPLEPAMTPSLDAVIPPLQPTLP